MQSSSSDGRRARHERVSQLMRRDFVSVDPGESLSEALGTMRMARLRHMCVARNGRLLGILSYRELQEREIARLEGRNPQALPARATAEDAMRDSPHTVTADTPLPIAAVRMARLGVGCLAVIERDGDETRLVGLVTEQDLLRAAYPLP